MARTGDGETVPADTGRPGHVRVSAGTPDDCPHWPTSPTISSAWCSATDTPSATHSSPTPNFASRAPRRPGLGGGVQPRTRASCSSRCLRTPWTWPWRYWCRTRRPASAASPASARTRPPGSWRSTHTRHPDHYGSATDAGPLTEDPAAIVPPNAPRGPEDANSLQPDGRYRPAPTRDADEDRPATQVTDPAPKDTWFGLRAHASSRRGTAPERFDPNADQSTAPLPGVLSGATTLVRTQIRRIQAPNGTWVRDYTLNLPVTTTNPDLTRQLNERITGLLDTHLNSGLELPGSRDQLHVNVNLIDDPAHPEAITLTQHTSDPARADQLHLDLGHSDADLPTRPCTTWACPTSSATTTSCSATTRTARTVRTTRSHGRHTEPRSTSAPLPPHDREHVTSAGPRLHDHAHQDETTPTRNPDIHPHPRGRHPHLAGFAGSGHGDTARAGPIPVVLCGSLRQQAPGRHGPGWCSAEPFSGRGWIAGAARSWSTWRSDSVADTAPGSVRERCWTPRAGRSLGAPTPALYLRARAAAVPRPPSGVGGSDRTVDVQLDAPRGPKVVAPGAFRHEGRGQACRAARVPGRGRTSPVKAVGDVSDHPGAVDRDPGRSRPPTRCRRWTVR
ncbi:hypothetical protein ACRAWF_43545 [Streptomyces sp. L7]